MAKELRCSFCRRSEHRVAKLVAGPDAYICDACIDLASRIVSADGSAPPRAPLWRRVVAAACGAVRGVLRRAFLAPTGAA